MTIIRKIVIAAPAAMAIFCTAAQPVQAGWLFPTEEERAQRTLTKQERDFKAMIENYQGRKISVELFRHYEKDQAVRARVAEERLAMYKKYGLGWQDKFPKHAQELSATIAHLEAESARLYAKEEAKELEAQKKLATKPAGFRERLRGAFGSARRY